jgi:hypothetical protein
MVGLMADIPAARKDFADNETGPFPLIRAVKYQPGGRSSYFCCSCLGGRYKTSSFILMVFSLRFEITTISVIISTSMIKIRKGTLFISSIRK